MSAFLQSPYTKLILLVALISVILGGFFGFRIADSSLRQGLNSHWLTAISILNSNRDKASPQLAVLSAREAVRNPGGTAIQQAWTLEVLRSSFGKCTGAGFPALKFSDRHPVEVEPQILHDPGWGRLVVHADGIVRFFDVGQPPFGNGSETLSTDHLEEVFSSVTMLPNQSELLGLPMRTESGAGIRNDDTRILAYWKLENAPPTFLWLQSNRDSLNRSDDLQFIESLDVLVSSRTWVVAGGTIASVRGDSQTRFLRAYQATGFEPSEHALMHSGVLLDRSALQGPIAKVAISPDGSKLAVLGQEILAIWDLLSPASAGRDKLQVPMVMELPEGVSQDIDGFIFSGDSSWLYLAMNQPPKFGGSGPATEIRAHMRLRIQGLEFETLRSDSIVTSVKVVSNSQADAIARAYSDGSIELWSDLSEDEPRKARPFQYRGICGTSAVVSALDLQSSRTRLAVGFSSGEVCVIKWPFNPADRSLDFVLTGQEQPIQKLQFFESVGTPFLAALSRDGSGRIWNLENPYRGLRLLRHGRSTPVGSVNYSVNPENNTAAIPSGPILDIWDLSSWKSIARKNSYSANGRAILAAALNDDASMVSAIVRNYLGNGDDAVVNWVFGAEKPDIWTEIKPDASRLLDGGGGFLIVQFRSNQNLVVDIGARSWRELPSAHVLQFSDEGSVFLVPLADDRRKQLPPTIIALEDLSRTELLLPETERPLDQMGFLSIAVHSRQGWIALGSRTGKILLFRNESLASKPAELELPVTGKRQLANALAFTKRGDKLAVGFSSGEVAIWSLKEGKLQAYWKAHPAEVASVCFEGDQGSLASGDTDGRVFRWRFRSDGTAEILDILPPLVANDPVLDIFSNRSADLLVVSYISGTIAVWPLNRDVLLFEASIAAGRTLTTEEKNLLLESSVPEVTSK